MRAEEAADRLVERITSRPWGLAVAAIDGDATELRLHPGADPLREDTLFQIGSVTKTMTGVLLAYAIVTGETTPEATIGEILGIDGEAASITLHELATQRSGLPRLPPNLDLASIDRADPYAAFTPADLLAGLGDVAVGPKEYAYSNFGFMALGQALAAVGGGPLPALLQSRIFDPLGMETAGCPPSDDGRIPGYSGPNATPWWSTQLPGPGGVGASIRDVAAYLRAHLAPPEGPLGQAIEMATTIHAEPPSPMGYGWGHQGGGWWHNGGTGGFRSFVAFHRPTSTAVALLANTDADMLDAVGFRTLTEMVQAATGRRA